MTTQPRIVIGAWWPIRQPTGDDTVIYVNFRDHSIRRGNYVVHLTPERFKMLAIVLAADPASYHLIRDTMYSDRADGGPTVEDGVRINHLFHIRRAVRSLGIEIVTRWGQGLEARIV